MQLEDIVGRAVERRYEGGLGLAGSATDSARMIDAAGDGIPGVWVDAFAGHWVISTEGARDQRPLAELLIERESVESVWWKRLDQKDKEPPTLLAGTDPGGRFTIRENGLTYLVDMSAGYSQGIFLDQRLNRARVNEVAADNEGATVLNLFAYTCAFSVAAANGGAVTTSLDLSPGYLDWGKDNFAANNIDPSDHFWCKGDAFDWLRRFRKSGRVFDGVILDPPTFSRGQGKKVFRAEEDFDELVELACGVVDQGGWMLCTTNCRRLPAGVFRAMVEQGRRRAGRTGTEETLPMPPEFSGDSYLKGMWLVFTP